MKTCERCRKPIAEGAEEQCGVCTGPLCRECHESHGFGAGHTDEEFRASWYVAPESR